MAQQLRDLESVKARLAAARLLQKSAAASTGPYTSGGVTALKALSGLLGGLQERQALQADADARQQGQAATVAALRELAGRNAGPAPSYGASAAAAAGSSPATGISGSAAVARADNPISTQNQNAFIQSALPHAQRIAAQTGIDPRLIVAQAALESNYGKSAPGGNLFGIKGAGTGPISTMESVNGQMVPTKASFASYDSPSASFDGYGKLMSGRRYAGVRDGADLDAQLSALGRSGYATDPNYAAKVGSIARRIPLGAQAQADLPAPNAQPVAAQGLPPGITPDMVSAPAGQPSSPFGAMPASMDQAPAASPAGPMMADAPPPDVSGLTPPPLGAAGSPAPMADQGGDVGGPAPSPQLLASLLSNGAPLQGSGSVLPSDPPLPPPGVQSGAQPGNPFGAMPPSMAQAPASVGLSNPGAAANLSPNGAMMAAMGPGGLDPAMGASLGARMRANALPASGLSTDQLPGMDNFGGDGTLRSTSITSPGDASAPGFTGTYNGGIRNQISGNLPGPDAYAGGPGFASNPTTAPSPPPSVMAAALRNMSAPTAPLPPSRPSDRALGLDPDAPAPNATPAGPAPFTSPAARLLARGPQLDPDPPGINRDGGGDRTSAMAFMRDEAAKRGAGASYTNPLARALAGQGPAAPAQPSADGPLDGLGRLFGLGGQGGGLGGLLGNLPIIGGLLGGGGQGGGASPAPASPSAPAQFTPGGQGAQPSAQAPGGLSPAIEAALKNEYVSDAIKLKLIEPVEHRYTTLLNGQVIDERGNFLPGNFAKPEPIQSITRPDGSTLTFDPSKGQYGAGAPAVPSPTPDMKNYDAYAADMRAKGLEPLGRLDYDLRLKQAGANSVSVDTRAETAEAAARGGGLAKRFNDIADDGARINDDAIKYQRLGELLSTVNTGPRTAYLEKVRQITGVSLDPNTDQVQALNSAIQQIVPTLRVPGSGTTSDRDQANFIQSLPTLAGSPGGNQKIMDTLQGMIAYRQQRVQIAQAYQNGDIRGKDADAQIAALPSPFAPRKDAPGSVAQPQVGAPDPSMARPADKAAYDALPSGTMYVAPDGRTMRKS